ncbi:hypothetical protein G7B40_023870 [Aetokthonos hydrillicola Thurmond2011]|jgi:hypothetical protein|uniref:Uncharacterized protein n=1 Tax=Aetokthonos hydrillicola Thurmond2011 TaxID=2712845 RepID=A0AAP5I9W1_9CYAN|nr:hypothetical protein [Aetokthonos hydrillicola]MBO3460211.1 hypothetical protein [Aetokthonos hydrillicola CCALA 1050]MBW4586944.1 hypothetical protein [Aetokthonos hydrillicola CCALA 1050]MDR9897581.1 hypothetical protein [Aetokthonos hydrillicola Thurmond2011]
MNSRETLAHETIKLAIASASALLLLAPSFLISPSSQASSPVQNEQPASLNSNCPGLLARGFGTAHSVTICSGDNNTYYMVISDKNGGQERAFAASPVDGNLNVFVAKNGKFTYTADFSQRKLITVERRTVSPSRVRFVKNVTTTEVFSSVLMS